MIELVMRTILSGPLLLSGDPWHLQNRSPKSQDTQSSEQTAKKFRYVIISEGVEDASDPDFAIWNVEVLLMLTTGALRNPHNRTRARPLV